MNNLTSWCVEYADGLLGQPQLNREVAIVYACRQLWDPDAKVVAVVGPAGIRIGRAALEAIANVTSR